MGRRPRPEERPRWERVRGFAERQWGRPVRALFFLNASSGALPATFVSALLAMEYRPIPLAGGGEEKVVDIAIQRTLRELRDRSADVVLVSNDGDFVDDLAALLQGDRRVAVIGFDEFRNHQFAALQNRGLELYDLEHDVDAFQSRLPRVRIIPIDEFDPRDFL